jgi:hypothetical protein
MHVVGVYQQCDVTQRQHQFRDTTYDCYGPTVNERFEAARQRLMLMIVNDSNLR